MGVAAVAVLAGWSCSSSPLDGADGSGGDSASGGSNAGGTQAGGNSAGGEASGGASPSGGAIGTGGTLPSGGAFGSGGTIDWGYGGVGAATSASPPDLFPLAVGNSWTTNAPSAQAACDATYPSQDVYATEEFNGQSAFLTSDVCFEHNPDTDSRLAVIGGEIAQWLDSSWQVTLPLPVEEGHTWTIQIEGTATEFRWAYAGDVTVQAGTFTGCWRRERTAEAGSFVTYCPGVGPVRWAGPAVAYEITSYDVQ